MAAWWVLLALAPVDALACGQSTHVWAALHAVEHVPAGPLRDLLADPALRDVLINGAMFPDGGYSPLVRDGYGEIAHWEPFQTVYMRRLKEASLEDDERRRRLVFWFGLAAHGMADQIYDGVYLTRSYAVEPEAWESGFSVDTATDVAFIAEVGAQPVVDAWAPWDEVVAAMADVGHGVDAETMQRGQASLQVAIGWVGATGSDGTLAQPYIDAYPWTNAHLSDLDTPGSPACIGARLAAVWGVMWDRWEGTFDLDRQLIVTSWPEDGAAGQPLDAGDIASTVSLVLARAVHEDSLQGRVHVQDAAGADVPVDVDMYYGELSNVLNLWPRQDWVDGQAYTVTLDPGISFDEDAVLGVAQSIVFTAGAAPAAPEVPDATAGCDCAAGGRPSVALAWLALGALRRRRW